MRRAAVLKAARKLLARGPIDELSLNALARASGVSKPNLYRYFESREHVLLQVWIEEVRALRDRLEEVFAALEPGDVAGVIAALVDEFAARPLLCDLMSIVSAVLERNLSVDAIVSAKENLATLTLHIAQLLHARLPRIPPEDCAWLAGTAATWVAGVWPAVHAPPAAVEALARPGLEAMRPVFRRDFQRVLTVLIRGLAG